MKEDFLHYVWRTKNFAQHNLCTTEGKSVQIIDFGHLNREGGPDFKGCKVQIDGILWAGSVEMHLASSSWKDHGHSSDPAYENVILHVVLEEDELVYIGRNRLPCIELRERIPGDLLARYQKLMQMHSEIPCAAHIRYIRPAVRDIWLQRMAIERLQTRAVYFDNLSRRFSNDWGEVLYVALARGFGFKSNADAMERLALAVPLRIVRAHADDIKALEALFFGCAGMLNRIFSDPYAAALQRTFDHLCRRHDLKPVDSRCWQWGRMRPSNLPTIRIAQFAMLMSHNHDFAHALIECRDTHAMHVLLKCDTSDYWCDHTDFDRPAKYRLKRLGIRSAERVMINTLIPFLFIYGKYRGLTDIDRRATDMLMEIAQENNRITRQWTDASMPNRHAADSQALLHLKRHFCDKFRCTECAIGHDILKEPQMMYGR